MSKDQVLLAALRALQEYHQLGTISNYKRVINDILLCFNDIDENQKIDSTMLLNSNKLMVDTIKKAKKNS